MFMPKAHRVAIYSYLFKEGALCVKKDPAKETHGEVAVPNLHVMKTMVSLKSRGYVREVYNWRWNYYFLTDEGIEYLRSFLHLPAEIQPATLMRPAARAARVGERRAFGAERGAGGFGRGGYDKAGPSGEFQPRFGGAGGYRRGGGIGRGAPQQ